MRVTLIVNDFFQKLPNVGKTEIFDKKQRYLIKNSDFQSKTVIFDQKQ